MTSQRLCRPVFAKIRVPVANSIPKKKQPSVELVAYNVLRGVYRQAYDLRGAPIGTPPLITAVLGLDRSGEGDPR